MLVLKSSLYCILLSLPLITSSAYAEQLSTSTEVKENITLLAETKSCPQCNLSGANLNRFDLSGANLEGANLSRAKMSLVNLSGANLKNADMREAVLNGADLADANLSGADFTGAALVGAYMRGAIMNGEMLATEPYKEEGISDIKEYVYVDDTAKPKNPQESEEMKIGERRDFEETPPPVKMVTVEAESKEHVAVPVVVSDDIVENVEALLPEESVEAPEAKNAPAIQEVYIEKETEEPVKLTDKSKKESIEDVSTKGTVVVDNGATEDAIIEEAFAKTSQPSDSVAEEIVTVTPVSENKDTLQSKNVKAEDTGIVQSMLNMFSSKEPSSVVLKNSALLLDLNKCYGCNLAGANLSGANLDGADLEGADLSHAILKGVDFEGANLKGVNFTGADLSGSDLSKADLYKANLTDADLTDVNLEKTLMDDVNLNGVKGYQNNVLMLTE